MKTKSLFVLVPLALVAFALPALAGDLVQLQDGKWLPTNAAPSGSAPSAQNFEDSNIAVTDEHYDFVYYRFTNVSVTQKQKIETAKVVRVFYQDPPSEYTDGANAMGNGDYATAIQRFTDVAGNSRHPDWARMYSLWNLGRIHQLQFGDMDRALEVWNRLQREYSKSRFLPEVIIYAGKALMLKGDIADARNKFLELERIPGLPEGQKALGKYYVIYIKQKQGETSGNSALLNQALNEYRSLLSSVESDSNLKQVATLARLGIGDCLLALGQHAEAQEFFRKIADTGTESAVLAGAYNGLGRCHLAKRQWKEALLAFLRTVVLYDEVPEQTAMALKLAGDSYAYLRSGDDWKDRAKELYRECMQKYPGSEAARGAEQGLATLR